MPQGIRGWAAWFAAQGVFTYLWKLAIKLAENAMLGWGDDQIAAALGITSPALSTVITWTIPFILAAGTLWFFHRVTTRPLKEALARQSGGDQFSATGVVFGQPRRTWIQRVEPSHIIILGLVIAAIGVGWQLYGGTPAVSSQKVTIPGTGNPLWDAINAYLKKNGRTSNGPLVTADTPTTFAMGEASDGRGPYITRWGSDLGPWPTTADGFTANQVRIFPAKRPHFATQYDREKFRAAVDDFSTVINSKIGSIITDATPLAGNNPVVAMNGGSSGVLEKLQKIRSKYQEVDQLLFVRGSSGNGALFDKYPSYRELLMGLLPDDWQPIWNDFNSEIWSFDRSITVLKGIETQNDTDLKTAMQAIIDKNQRALAKSVGDLKEWIARTNKRIDLITRVI